MSRKMTDRRAGILYTVLQMLYWVSYCLQQTFNSVFLQDLGFTDGQMGILMSLIYLSTVLLQPIVARIMNRNRIPIRTGMIAMTVICLVLCPVIMIVTGNKILVSCVQIVLFGLFYAMTGTLFSVPEAFAAGGIKVDFGLSRGLGSMAYSVCSFLMGRVLMRVSSSYLPVYYTISLTFFLLTLLVMKIPRGETEEGTKVEEEQPRGSIFRNRLYLFILFGSALTSIELICIERYMLQIMQSFGAGSAEMGYALSLSSFVEVPAMILYSRTAKKFGNGPLLALSGWAYLLKNVLVSVAPSPGFIIAVAVIQYFSFGTYLPASVACIAEVLPQQDLLQGQSLNCSAFTLGSLIATFLGGFLIERLGIHGMLNVMHVFTVAGAVCYTMFAIAVKKRKAQGNIV